MMAASRKNQDDPQAEANAAAGVTETAEKVQAAVDTETEQGFRGVEVDSTPNEAYTVKGVLAGMPTPETDAEHAEKVRRDQRAAAAKANTSSER
jgi:hypothetical protein